MRPGDVFRLAAEMIAIEDENYSCCAVSVAASHLGASDGERLQLVDRYARVISPFASRMVCIADFEGHGHWAGNPPRPEARAHRIIALLTIAALADTDDLMEGDL